MSFVLYGYGFAKICLFFHKKFRECFADAKSLFEYEFDFDIYSNPLKG
jgi:hypothetical protein